MRGASLHKRHSLRVGLTLFELLLVVAITLILGSIGWLNMSSRRCTTELTSTTKRVGTILRDASNRSMTQQSSSFWGIHFNNSSTRPFYALFANGSGSYYAPYTQSNAVERYVLPLNVRYTPSSLAIGASTSIVFNSAGIPAPSTTLSLEIVDCSKYASSTLRVMPSGLIEF